MIFVGRRAPDFVAHAVLADGSMVEDFNLYDEIKAFWHSLLLPNGFYVCLPTELLASTIE